MKALNSVSSSTLRHYAQLGLAGLALACAVPATAATTISVENGGITLNSFNTGTAGSLADAWLINETMTSSGTLKLLADPNGSPVGPGNPTLSGHSSGRWFTKTVTNDTGVDWTSFELELQIVLGTPSLDGDGLSFAQGAGFTFTSDKFGAYSAIEDIRDYLNFHDGIVADGETVSFTFAVTDNSANNPFWLLQTENKEEFQAPEPGTLALLGLASFGLLGVRRRKSA